MTASTRNQLLPPIAETAGTPRQLSPSVISCDRKTFSFYRDFIGKYWTFTNASQAAIHRICVIARQLGVGAIVMEDVSGRPDVADEIASLDRARPGCQHDAIAVSFFRTTNDFDVQDDLQVDEKEEYEKARRFVARAADRTAQQGRHGAVGHFLGQVIIVNHGKSPGSEEGTSYIYEAIISPPDTMLGQDDRLLLDTYNICVLGSVNFSVRAAYYCQQNGITSGCGHAVLRMVLNTPSLRITGREIAQLLGAEGPGVGERSPQKMFLTEVAWVIKNRPQKGRSYAKPLSAAPDAPRSPHYELLLNAVATLDGGNHVLLTHTTAHGAVDDTGHHIVAVIGYSIDRNLWNPQAVPKYDQTEDAPIDSSDWARHLIVHDDNFGPYRTLGMRSFPPSNAEGERESHRLSFDNLIGVFPHDIRGTPHFASTLARYYLRRIRSALYLADGVRASITKEIWIQELFEEPGEQVMRPVLMSRDRYIGHLRKLRGVRGSDNCMTEGELSAIQASLPSEWFWMIELSHTLLYTGIGNKIGELLIGDWDGNKATQDEQLWCRVRLPHHFLPDVKGDVNIIPVSLWDHAEVYRFDQ